MGRKEIKTDLPSFFLYICVSFLSYYVLLFEILWKKKLRLGTSLVGTYTVGSCGGVVLVLGESKE
jgi:hypothetical protein